MDNRRTDATASLHQKDVDAAHRELEDGHKLCSGNYCSSQQHAGADDSRRKCCADMNDRRLEQHIPKPLDVQVQTSTSMADKLSSAFASCEIS